MDKLNETISKLEAWIDDQNAMDTEIDACIVADALELLKEQKWYSVNEKLPDEYAMYFVYTEKGHIYKVEFRPDEDYKEEPYYQWGYVESDAPEGWVSFYDTYEDDYYNDKILYWRKFPKPPKDGDGE